DNSEESLQDESKVPDESTGEVSDEAQQTADESTHSSNYREPVMTDGILVDDIFKAIDQLAETGECDLGSIIFHCESMRYAG
ncbi:hypothetical protein EVA_21885, partial [gut metagenome]